MTDEELTAIEERAKATLDHEKLTAKKGAGPAAGKWLVWHLFGDGTSIFAECARRDVAEFFAACAEDVPALVAEVRRLRVAEREGYKRGVEAAVEAVRPYAVYKGYPGMVRDDILPALAALSPGSERGGG